MELASLCQSLTLSDDEEDVVACDLGEIARDAGEKKVANSLIGKIMSTKRVNREGFIQTVSYLWRTKEPLTVEAVGMNLFVFHFGAQEDRRRVLAGGPWNYLEKLIVLEVPTGLGDYNSMAFDQASFWVQIHNLPLMCLSKEAGRSLGANLGLVEEVDPGASGDCTGRYIRVRVKMNITKPLKRGLKVKVDDKGNTVMAVLWYERLPDLCYQCGIIGHPLLECPKRSEEGKTTSLEKAEKEKDKVIGDGKDRDKAVVPTNVGEGAAAKGMMLTNSCMAGEEKRVAVTDFSGLIEIEVERDFETREKDFLARSKQKGHMEESNKAGLGVRAKFKGFKKSPRKPKTGIKKPMAKGKKVPLGDISNLIGNLEAEKVLTKEGVGEVGRYAKVSEELSQPRDYNSEGATNNLKAAEPVQQHSVLNGNEDEGGEDQRYLPEIEDGGYFSVDCVGKSGGLAVLWDDFSKISIISSSNFYIDCMIQNSNGTHWRFTGFYGNPVQSQRVHSWTLLERLSSVFSGPWICGGDFNEISEASEKQGGGSKAQYLMTNFNQALERSSLFDAGGKEYGHTWWGKRGNMVIRERLDRFVINVAWKSLFPNSKVSVLDGGGSDHKPIIMMDKPGSTEIEREEKKRSRFHFEELWTTDARFDEVVQNCWAESGNVSSISDLTPKLMKCSRAFKNWGRNTFGDLKRRIAAKKEELRLILNSNDESISVSQIISTENSLNKLLKQEEIAWKQRARAEWLAHGDRNTRYFHRRASQRRARNRIRGLRDASGTWKEKPKEVEDIVQDYFQDLFQTTNPSESDIEEITNHVGQVVTEEMNSVMSARYKADEIMEALKEINATKAPALIPKVSNVERMCDFRPISLCNVIYKIISKTLANRLRRVIGRVIDCSQNAFIPGRQIIDSALIGFECVHVIKKSTRKVNGPLALKLDMSKAYERVEWKFIEAMMLKLGFNGGWVEKVMRCVSSVRFSFLINGVVKGACIPSRGLRQGDPLSPYLFLICAQGLSSIINNRVNAGLIQGVEFGDNCKVSHIFFADDSFLFARANVQECGEIRRILEMYSKGSGQIINLDKSALSFGKGVSTEARKQVQDILQVPIVPCHEKYLGLPSTVGRNKGESFKTIKEKIWKKLQSWK
ncbi:uncharacterized protein LOC126672813 [Mercurialis annua]|uniref:uncharacterized protein LOC126672813 n=1 Tax=Mercurialis annua TaxID=3986 RepID=UPI002160FAD1|nr:uncharacterized protein LOC126672813 [Mercurialis annua]